MPKKEVIFHIVRNDGPELFIDGRDWGIPNDGLENWANLPHEVTVTDNVGADGGMVSDTRIGVVDRTITAQLKSNAGNEAWRRFILSFFNPKNTYRVHATYQGITRWCEGVQYGFKLSEGNVYDPISFTWTILCTQPYMLSEDDFGKDIAALAGKYGFPWVSVVEVAPEFEGKVYQRGFITGAYSFSDTLRLDNEGDVETYIRARIEATGYVKNPRLFKDDKFVRLLGEMDEGDVLTIDFESRPPRIELNGDNVIHMCDRRSSFTGFSMGVGENTVRYGADDGSDNMSVSLYYNQRYLGI